MRINELLLYNHMDESQEHNVQWKKPVTEEYTLCDSSYIKFNNRQNQFFMLEIWRVVTLGEGF